MPRYEDGTGFVDPLENVAPELGTPASGFTPPEVDLSGVLGGMGGLFSDIPQTANPAETISPAVDLSGPLGGMGGLFNDIPVTANPAEVIPPQMDLPPSFTQMGGLMSDIPAGSTVNPGGDVIQTASGATYSIGEPAPIPSMVENAISAVSNFVKQGTTATGAAVVTLVTGAGKVATGAVTTVKQAVQQTTQKVSTAVSGTGLPDFVKSLLKYWWILPVAYLVGAAAPVVVRFMDMKRRR